MEEAKQVSDLVKSMLEAKIIEAFRSTPEMIDELVRAVLEREVDSIGHPAERYHSRDKMPYLTYLARNAIEGIARKAVTDWFAENKSLIREKVHGALKKGNFQDAIVKAVCEAMAKDYNVRVTFDVQKEE